jgi:hypothetical protein
MRPAGHGLPNQRPKDSPEYRAWHAKLIEGNRQADRPVFDPRDCDRTRGGCGQSFNPKVGNQRRCDACIARTRYAKQSEAAR